MLIKEKWDWDWLRKSNLGNLPFHSQFFTTFWKELWLTLLFLELTLQEAVRFISTIKFIISFLPFFIVWYYFQDTYVTIYVKLARAMEYIKLATLLFLAKPNLHLLLFVYILAGTVILLP